MRYELRRLMTSVRYISGSKPWFLQLAIWQDVDTVGFVTSSNP